MVMYVVQWWSLEDVRMIFFSVGTARASCVSSLHSALGLLVDYWPVVQMSGFKRFIRTLPASTLTPFLFNSLWSTRYTFLETKDKELLLTEG